MGIVEIRDLRKSYKNKVVLNGLNLDIRAGEFWGLVGKNGAGKSTLINILCGVVNKSSGTFSICNAEETALNTVKREIGIMPDVSELFGDMTGSEFLFYMMSLKRKHLNKKDISSLFEKVELNVSMKAKIKTYSFGMKKKIAIAQAIADNPKLLILDEPTSGVDPASVIHLQNLFEKLNQGGTTIFMASHNLDEINRLCSHIAILNRGVFQVSGGIEDVINEHTKKITVKIQCHRPDDFNISSLVDKYSLLEATDLYLVFEVKAQSDIPHLINALVSCGVSIFSVALQKTTLEDIFLS